MAITSEQLKLEIGAEAYSELTIEEIDAICQKYNTENIVLAGQTAFQLLMKKFQPNYRMGRMYEDLSEKFKAYQRLYEWYSSMVNAGLVQDIDSDKQLDVGDFLP